MRRQGFARRRSGLHAHSKRFQGGVAQSLAAALQKGLLHATRSETLHPHFHGFRSEVRVLRGQANDAGGFSGPEPDSAHSSK